MNLNLPTISRESDGYLQSFDVEDKEYLKFLNKYNFVILKILSEKEADDTVEDFFKNVTPNVDKYDSSTWENQFWPLNTRFLAGYALTQYAFDNRTHSNLHTGFSNIFGTDDLVTMVDRWGIMRPSKNRKDWKWELKPHVDVNPWKYTEELDKGYPHQYQGVLSLVDSYDTWCSTGGFRIVPGCANILKEWTKRFPDPTKGEGVSYHLTETDPLYNKLQRIPLRKGEVCIWDSGCVHANFSNTSSTDFRLVQYVSMAPAATPPSRVWSHWPSVYFKNNKTDTKSLQLTSRQTKLLQL
jgi:hypothetical protein